MIRIGSVMHLHAGCEEEYKKRHDKLWPEMAKELKAHGASEYSIFLDEKSGRPFFLCVRRGSGAVGQHEPNGCVQALVGLHEGYHGHKRG